MLLLLFSLSLIHSLEASHDRPSVGTKIAAYSVAHFGTGTWNALYLPSAGLPVTVVDELPAFSLVDPSNERTYVDLALTKQWTTNSYGTYTLNNGVCYRSPSWTFSFAVNVSFSNIRKSDNLRGHSDLYSGLYIDYASGNMAYDTVIDYRTGYIEGYSWTQPLRYTRSVDGGCPPSYNQFYGEVTLSDSNTLGELPNPLESYFELPSICNETSPVWVSVFCWNTVFH